MIGFLFVQQNFDCCTGSILLENESGRNELPLWIGEVSPQRGKF
jgi:hypothetical protein